MRQPYFKAFNAVSGQETTARNNIVLYAKCNGSLCAHKSLDILYFCKGPWDYITRCRRNPKCFLHNKKVHLELIQSHLTITKPLPWKLTSGTIHVFLIFYNKNETGSKVWKHQHVPRPRRDPDRLTSFLRCFICSRNLLQALSCSARMRLPSSRRRTVWSISIFSMVCFCCFSSVSSSVS